VIAHEQNLDILIVDDDDGHGELVRRNLKRSGFANPIYMLTRGQDALDYVFCTGTYRERTGNGHLLILLDLKMPGTVDGMEVLRQIKADPLKKKIPIVMLTTTDDPREVNRCYELGCSVYMRKPIDPTEFVEAIRRLGLFISVVSIPTENGKK
jgi:CheY-like chemotaxis protein